MRLNQLRLSEGNMQPRVIRLRDAPDYLGMDLNRFNKEVRPHIEEFSVGIQGIGFDRLDLDAWLVEYKRRNGRPKEKKQWDAKERQDFTSVRVSGTSIKSSTKGAFAKVLAQVTSKKQSVI